MGAGRGGSFSEFTFRVRMKIGARPPYPTPSPRPCSLSYSEVDTDTFPVTREEERRECSAPDEGSRDLMVCCLQGPPSKLSSNFPSQTAAPLPCVWLEVLATGEGPESVM